MKNIQENDENRYLIDLKLLSSLKPIKGKVISLENKINYSEINMNLNNLNNDKKNNIEDNYLNSNLIFPGKLDINIASNNNFNYNNIQNQMNSNMSIKDQFGLMDNHMNENIFQSILSYGPMKSKEGYNMINDNINNNKISQESFYLMNNNLFEDENNKNKITNIDNMNLYLNNNNNNNIINNNIIYNNINNYYNNMGNFNINNFNINNNVNRLNSDLSFNLENFDDYLYKKRKTPDIKKQINQKGNSTKKIMCLKKTLFKTQKNNILINKNKINKPKILFNCYQSKQKSKYRKQKNKKNNFSFPCSHTNCQYVYKTLKQLQNHHYKMIPECQNDLILLLKNIYNTKTILVNNISNDINKMKYFSELYESSIKNISFNQYTETISGIHLDEFNIS